MKTDLSDHHIEAISKPKTRLSPEDILIEVQRNDWNDDKDLWKSKVHYVVVLLMCCATFHNIYGCPLASLRYGGLSFVVPYTILTVALGVPLHFLQLFVGQYSRRGFTGIWDAVPLSRGIGWATLCACLLFLFCINAHAAYSIAWFSLSLQKSLPWRDCDRPVFRNRTCAPKFFADRNNSSYSPAEHFFYDHLLQIDQNDTYTSGRLVWHLVFAQIYCWFSVYVGTCQHLRSIEKAAIVVVVTTVVCATAMSSIIIQLKGAAGGVGMLLVFRLEYLLKFETWTRAAEQVLLELVIGQGSLFVLGRHLHHRSKCEVISRRIIAVNYLSSLTWILVTWSLLGASEIPISYNPIPVYVLYAEALSRLPFANMWCAIAFLLLFTAAISHQLILTFGALSTLKDQFSLRDDVLQVIAAFFCLFFAIVGIVLSSSTGFILLNAVWDAARLLQIPLAFLTAFSFSFIYGIGKYCEDVHFLIGHYPSFLYRLSLYAAPLLLFVAYYGNCGHHESHHPSNLKFPLTFLTCAVMSAPPLFFAFRLTRYAYNGEMARSWRSSEKWGPKNYRGRVARTFFTSDDNRFDVAHPWMQ